MLNRLLHLALLFILTTFIAIGCDSGGGSGGGGNSCDGPVPCATTDWGDTYYEFIDADGYSMLINSDGAVFGGAGLTDDGDLMALAGEVVDCNNGKITTGGRDYNWDGIVDYWFATASGNVNICGTTMSVTNIYLDGDSYPDIIATYVGVAASTIQVDQSDSAQAIISETLNRLRDE
jgi:hypothetical protein